MENKIEVFKNEELGEIRTLNINNDPWFIAMDISEKLGYSETSVMLRRLEEDEMTKIEATEIVGTNSMARTITIVNESGLYNCIFGSKLESAKKFRKWVFSEVLPSIRKHGLYITEELLQDNEKLKDVIDNLKYENSLKNNEIKELEEVRSEYMEQRDKIFRIDIKTGSNGNGSFIPYCILQIVREFLKDENNIQYRDNDIIKVDSRNLIKYTKKLFPKGHDAQSYLSQCLDIRAWDSCTVIPTKILMYDYEPIQDILY